MSYRRVGLISPPKWFSYCGLELEGTRPGDLRVMNTQLRLPPNFSYDLEEIAAATPEIRAAAQSLASSDVEFIGQIGTPFAMIHGWNGACELEESIQREFGVPFEMMGLSLVRKCREMGISSVSACTVFFTREWTDAYAKFLSEAGVKTPYIGSFADLGVLQQYTMLESCDGHNICTKELMVETVTRCCEEAPSADAILLSGLPCPQIDMLADLEAVAGKPVISYPAIYARILQRLGLSANPPPSRMFSVH